MDQSMTEGVRNPGTAEPLSEMEGGADAGVGRRSAFRRFAAGAALAGGAGMLMNAMAARPAHAADGEFVERSGRSVSVWDYGAVGDGVADDSAAITAAAAAAGEGGTVSFEKGTHKTARFNIGTKGVKMLAFQTWHGGTVFIGGGPTVVAEIVGTNIEAGGVGITAGTSCTLRELRLLGPGGNKADITDAAGKPQPYAIGLKSEYPTFRADRVQFFDWPLGEHLRYVWYSEHTECEWRWNATGQFLDLCYRVDNIGPMFNGNVHNEMKGGTAIKVSVARSVNIFGGSIEVYGDENRPGVLMTGGTPSAITFFGTYFESSFAHSGTQSVAIKWNNNWAVNLIGCTAYLVDTKSFLHGAVTGASLNASGNIFVAAKTSLYDSVAYRIQGSSNTVVDINGTDNWTAVERGIYTDLVLPQPQVRVAKPILAGDAQVDYHGRNIVLPPGTAFRTGTTTKAGRPKPADAGVGAMLFDTTLGGPIWSSGTAWVDGKGKPV